MFLPTSLEEMRELQWDMCDVIIVTPDAYVDHPSFAMALLGRFLQAHGYRVGILSQPEWQKAESFLKLGVPRLAWAISGGNVDSMVLNYTANKKRRMEDAYAEDGNAFFPNTEKSIKNKIRPDRTLLVYCNQIRQVNKDKPLIIGGLEASLRRLAHYDYWSNSVKRSILFDAKADILVYGMGEYPLLEILQHLEKQIPFTEWRIPNTAMIFKQIPPDIKEVVLLPSFEEVKNNKEKFALAFRLFYEANENQVIIQKQDTRYLIQFPRSYPQTKQLDFIYSLPYERKPHFRYQKPIPAFEMIKNSITSHRGCFGGCGFCSIATHQGGRIISRSLDSLLQEIKILSQNPDFDGVISDIGGPSANMYGSRCKIDFCHKPDCLHKQNQSPCPHLQTHPEEYLSLLEKAKKIPGIKKIFIGSGIRVEPFLLPPTLLLPLLKNHTSGQIKIAPESGSALVLQKMRKNIFPYLESFCHQTNQIIKQNQWNKKINAYFMIGYPGEGEKEFQETLAFVRKHSLYAIQCQIFTPTPLTLASALYYLEADPFTGEKITVEKNMTVLEQRKKRLIECLKKH